jgi:hypothetical protein
MIAGDLLTEPVGRLERLRLLSSEKLDLGDDQALGSPAYVHFDLQFPERNDVAALLEPPALGQCPKLVEAGLVELNLGFLPREARAALRGEQEPIALAADPDLPIGPIAR